MSKFKEEHYFAKVINDYYLCPVCGNTCKAKGDITSAIKRKGPEENKVRYRINGELFNLWCEKCDSYMFRCDKDMVKPIKKLNLNNIKTWVCCSGHLDYIIYADHTRYDLSTAYIGFYTEYNILERLFNENEINYWHLEEGQCNAIKPYRKCYILRVDEEPLNALSVFVGDVRVEKFKEFKKKYMEELNRMVNILINYVNKYGIENILADTEETFVASNGIKYQYDNGFLYELNENGGKIYSEAMTDVINKYLENS